MATSAGAMSSVLLNGDEDRLLACEAAGIGTWRWDLATNLVTLSPRAREMVGALCAQLSYARFLETFDPSDRDITDRMLRQSLAPTGAPGDAADGTHDFDVRTLPAGGETDGKSHWLRLRGRRVDNWGKPTGVRGIMIDAARPKAEENSLRRLASIIESSNDGIAGCDLDGIVTAWNRGAEIIFGYSAAEMIGQSIGLLQPPGCKRDGGSLIERVKRGELVEHFETQRRRKDGTIIDVSLTVSPLWDREGHLLGVSAITRDITAAKQAQIALAERQMLLQSILDTAPHAVVVADHAGIIHSFSTTATRLFGYANEEAIGLNVSVLMPSPYRERHDEYVARYLRTGERHVVGIERVVVGRRKDGSTFSMEITMGDMQSGERHLFTAFVRDVTKRQKDQQRLQELQAELIHMSRFTTLSDMTSTLAHELNQPLTAAINYLKGSIRLLDLGNSDNIPSVRDAMNRATEQTLRVSQIIRHLHDMVARGKSDRQAEDPVKLIEDASELALAGAKENGVRVKFAFDPEGSPVLADQIQIQQVLLNLMRNAMEAMQDTPRRELTISTRQVDPENLRIDVADTGPGISAEVARQLFQPFITTKRHGTGLGLSISRTIVEAHGGRIWAEPNPGGGAIFSLTLKTFGVKNISSEEALTNAD